MKKIFISLMILFFVSMSAFAQSNPMKADVDTVTMTTENTEYSWTIPNGVGCITVQCRGAYDIKLCFTSGESGTSYNTLKSGNAYYETDISSFGNTIYFQCATAGQILEIIYWY